MPGVERQRSRGNGRLRRLRRAVTLVVLAWCVVVSASLGWNLYNTWNSARDLATREARTHFNKDQAFRYWASRHGGVYVEVDERTPPNPALAQVPERDLTTPSGRHLTLMNPAYMMRQVMNDYGDTYGVRGRITSLKPVNPDNAPDAWETQALRRFEAGEREVFEVADKDGAPYLRLMHAMPTEQSCLKCHGHQGYKVGDVRGGVGVAVPLESYFSAARTNIRAQGMSHGLIWLVGLGAILAAGRRFGALAQEDVADQERLAALSHRLELVLSAVSDGIVGLDQDGLVRFANPAASVILGYGPGELLGQDMHEAVAMPGDAALPLNLGVDSGRIAQLFRRKDGTAVPVEMAVTAVAESGQSVGAVVVFRDVSERLEGETRTRQLMERLAQSNQDLQQFAYIVSHDLQEPLRMVSSYIQLLGRRLGPSLTEECREFIGFAVDGATRMSRMITDLLDYSRVHRRGTPFGPVDLNTALRDALANLSTAMADSGAEIKVGELPMVTGDASQLMRVFQNLLGNALKYRRPDGVPHIAVSAAQDSGQWVVSVADDGIGIDPAVTGRLFQVFQRLHPRGAYEGTGVGLALCRRILERHGGRIWVDSPGEGRGCTFRFALPVAPPPEAALA